MNVTSAEKAKPVAKVKRTWHSPGLALRMAMELIVGPNR
jgi:hypothetical protein